MESILASSRPSRSRTSFWKSLSVTRTTRGCLVAAWAGDFPEPSSSKSLIADNPHVAPCIEIVSEDAYAQICIRQLFSASRPRLNSPAHSRDLVLDCVDRLPGHRRFSKTSQVGWRRLWVRIGPRTIGVQDGRQGHGSPLALRTSGQRHFCNPAHCAAQLLFNIHDFLYESVGQPAPRLSNVARAAFAREESKGNGPIPFPSTKNPA